MEKSLKKERHKSNEKHSSTNKKPESLESCLEKMKKRLERHFKKEFIAALSSLVHVEYCQEDEFQENFNKSELNKLDYFAQQFKKICKNKKYLHMLSHEMLISNKSHHQSTPSTSKPATTSSNNDFNSLQSDFDYLKCGEYFSLVQILIRFTFKLLKYTQAHSELSTKSERWKNSLAQLNNLKCMLMSSLADLCYYEDMRLQILNDVDLKCLLCIFVNKCSLESQSTSANESTSTNLILWSKMCRLTANLCIETNLPLIKNLFSSGEY